MSKHSRRAFLKRFAAVGAAAIAFPTILIRKAHAYGWARGSKLHPKVNDLKVVGMIDGRMTTDYDPGASWSQQEKILNKTVIEDDIDRMVSKLTNERNPDRAWKTLFVKPPKKSWGDTVVAIKVDNSGQQHAHSPILSRICHALTYIVGVKGSNIHIYDGYYGSSMKSKTPWKGLPSGCTIEGKWGGIGRAAKVGAPWKGKDAKCIEPLVKNKVDILVNVSMCKGHQAKFGNMSMTMLNHFGTFDPRPGNANDGDDYLIAINQTPEILGEMNGAGQVLYPRQQLCVVDALWASHKGPDAPPNAQPNCVIIGTFAPVVDYQTAIGLRQKKLDWPTNRKMVDRFLSDFGYTTGDLPGGGTITSA